MSELLTKEELAYHLSLFREILTNFDFSEIKNIRFFNLESFYHYMNHVPNNPFKRQYEALEEQLDYIQPYLPFVSEERADEFLKELSGAVTEKESRKIKEAYTKKLRIDFISVARVATTKEEWENIMDACEQIRMHKEEMLLALN